MNKLIRTPKELDLMRQSGKISACALKAAISFTKPGVTLLEIESLVTEKIESLGGSSAFKSVPGYKWTTCLSLNQEVVHGLPSARVLLSGDVLSIDLGTIYQGWYTDCAWTVVVGKNQDKKIEKFLRVGEEAMWRGVKQAYSENQVGDISQAMQGVIEKAGFGVVKSLSGHGVGRSYHEEPEIPGFGKAKTGPKLYSGMTLAVESIYTAGTGDVYEAQDGWTITSSDKTLGGMFEMSLIVGESGAEVITDWRKC
ncbi:MAG: type I methionyl aminopeptidase [Candidatus Daviesbacteria bacterium]|nr:type I methionyl aminopeptidase [Candidatus Daviesbacteria bacterium]